MGKPIQPWAHRRRRSWWLPFLRARLPISLALLGLASVGYVATDKQRPLPGVHHSGTSLTHSAVRRVGCDIKGNINDRGEHIYHVPGQEYYSATRINPARGERWFCSEWEAWWAGWRKAKV
ncbi:sunset domain-containing protein [Mesorhizobium australicum]|uniref:sunset domain-containing protein n=1 Tax=Mesorhizobium australicum TaxID=536018 RepID=UPI003EBA5D81